MAKDKKNLIQDITNRYRVTAREARDIVTAIGTSLNQPTKKAVDKNYPGAAAGRNVEAASKNLRRQISETISAAKTGKKGTTSDKTNTKGFLSPKIGPYEKGTKRK